MVSQILFAIILWLVVTMATPSKLRIFISVLTGVLLTILIIFLELTPREPMVSVPEVGDQKAYELPFKDYKTLITPPVMLGVIKIPQSEELSKLGKSILTSKDLSPEQLKSLELLQGYTDFSAGKLGIILRFVPPTVHEGHLIPSYQGVEFTALPYYEELKAKEKILETKSKVLDAIREEVFKEQAPQL